MKTKRLTESAMLLALAIVLELISKAIIPEMPFGGQVTLVAMLPVVLISYRYGVKWGFVSGFCYALLEMALGAKTVSAAFQPGYFGDDTMIFKAILMCLLDYLLAYTMMGLGGIFREGDTLPRFVILTAEANDSVRPVHARMPVVLPAAAVGDWLADEATAAAYMRLPMPPLLCERA